MDLNVLIVGGGIHGVGLLHDLTSRGIGGVHLVERSVLASGTSSRSTKLVHGGLRYLEHISQWPLVFEALRERSLLLHLLSRVVKPIPFVLPHFRDDKRSAWLVRSGLFLYDLLAQSSVLPRSRSLSTAGILQQAPYLNEDIVARDMTSGFLYYDAQMLDDVIVRIAAHAAQKLGGTFEEHASVVRVEKRPQGFRVGIQNAEGYKEVTARCVINAAGAWNNSNLMTWGFVPSIPCLLNLGAHLVFRPGVCDADVHTSAACLLQNDDGRVVFFIPWDGKWLLGTTESVCAGRFAGLETPESDKQYLLRVAERYLNLKDTASHLDEVFSGLRCMPLVKTQLSLKTIPQKWAEDPFSSPFYVKEPGQNISALSREVVIHEDSDNLFSLYGGKWTTYRAVCERLGGSVARRLGSYRPSGTHVPQNWFFQELLAQYPNIFVSSRALRQL